MQPFHLQYAPLSSSIQRPWNDFSLWFGWIVFLSARIFLDGLEKHFRYITGIGNSCFPPNVDLSNQTIWFQLNLRQKEKNCAISFVNRLLKVLFFLDSLRPCDGETTTLWVSQQLWSFDGLQNSLLKAFSFNCVLRSTATHIWGHIGLCCTATVSKYKPVY